MPNKLPVISPGAKPSASDTATDLSQDDYLQFTVTDPWQIRPSIVLGRALFIRPPRFLFLKHARGPELRTSTISKPSRDGEIDREMGSGRTEMEVGADGVAVITIVNPPVNALSLDGTFSCFRIFRPAFVYSLGRAFGLRNYYI